MQARKADWLITREAEQEGMMVSMLRFIKTKNRTPLNEELGNYFNEKMPDYEGSYDEWEGEDVLYALNEHMKHMGFDRVTIDFPIAGGTDVHLVPFSKNLHLKVVVADEYYGSGDYSKYVSANQFMINENTKKEDVDILIKFLNEKLNV